MKVKVVKRRSVRKRPQPNVLRTKIVRIGNSRGIRLPKSVIEQTGMTDAVDISVRGNQVILQPAQSDDPRAGWEEAFQRSIEKYGPAERIDPDWELMPNEFDEKEWTW